MHSGPVTFICLRFLTRSRLRMTLPHSPLPAIATPDTKAPSTYTRRSHDSAHDLVHGTPLQPSPGKNGSMVRMGERKSDMADATATRYSGKTKWGLLLVFSVSQVSSSDQPLGNQLLGRKAHFSTWTLRVGPRRSFS